MSEPTKQHRLLPTLGAVLLLLIVGGCSDSDAADGNEARTASQVPVVKTSSDDARGAPSPPAATSSPDPEHGEPPVTFIPPFPDREDLFVPPQTTPQIINRPDGGGDVVLKGFANVGGLRAVLAIGGTITSLEAGETKGDIRVIAIDPPRVTLQQGDVRWTESLFNGP